MKKISLQFKDVLLLLEFIDITQTHACLVDAERAIITCEFTDAAIELAVNGYKASVVSSVC